jgi:hypothetical protein
MVDIMPEYTDTFSLPSGAGGMGAGMKYSRIKDRMMEWSHDTGLNIDYKIKGYNMILVFENKEDYAVYQMTKADYFSEEKINSIPGRRFK